MTPTAWWVNRLDPIKNKMTLEACAFYNRMKLLDNMWLGRESLLKLCQLKRETRKDRAS